MTDHVAEARRLRRTSQKRGPEKLPLAQGQGPRPREATQRPRSGATAERSYSTFKNRRGSCEEIPLFQGKEQRLRFAGAAVKRYPMSKVRETHVRR